MDKPSTSRRVPTLILALLPLVLLGALVVVWVLRRMVVQDPSAQPVSEPTLVSSPPPAAADDELARRVDEEIAAGQG